MPQTIQNDKLVNLEDAQILYNDLRARTDAKVSANQGAGNAGKALGIDVDGSVIPVPFSGEDFTGATASTAGTHGYVPAPAAGDNIKYLKGDGTWSTVPVAGDFTGATSSAAGAHGLVPAPAAGDNEKYLKGDGTWDTVEAVADDFTGATATTAGEHGLVPAPSAGDQTKVLTGDGSWQISPGAKVYVKTVEVTNVSGAYSQTFTDENISADMKAIELEINRAYVFGDVITVTPSDGSVTITCSNVSGTDTIKISLIKVIDDPTAVTSTEFTILNNRLLAVENVCTENNIVIETTDWSSTEPYSYEWESELITSASSVEVFLRDGAENAGIEDFDYVKTTGKVTFISSILPTGELPLMVKIINAKADAFQDLSAENVSTSVIPGMDNVEDVLTEMNSNISDNTDAISDNTQAIAKLEGYSDVSVTGVSNISTIRNDAWAKRNDRIVTIAIGISYIGTTKTGWQQVANASNVAPNKTIYFVAWDFDVSSPKPVFMYIGNNGDIGLRDPTQGHNYYGVITYIADNRPT